MKLGGYLFNMFFFLLVTKDPPVSKKKEHIRMCRQRLKALELPIMIGLTTMPSTSTMRRS